LPEAREPISELRTAAAFIGELRHEQGKRLSVTCYAQRPGVHRIEPGIAYQPGRELFRRLIVSAVDQARWVGLAACVEYAEQDLARERTEGGNDPRPGDLSRKLLRPGGAMTHDERGVIRVHRQRAADEDLLLEAR
jgi:hypothetical protein